MEILQVIYPSQFNLCKARGTYIWESKIAFTHVASRLTSFMTLGKGAVCIAFDTRIL